MANIDTQALAAFISVAEHMSFSEAAEHLHLSQSAVSKRIALLEQQLGTALFDRIRRKIYLTEAGQLLLPKARGILRELDDAQQMVSDLDGDVRGSLAIAFSHHIGLHRLPPYLQHFSSQFPDVKLNIQFVDSEVAYSLLLKGEIELALITLSPEHATDIVASPLWADPLAFVCSPSHPLHLRDNVALSELSKHDAILAGENTYTGKIVQQLFEQQNLSLKISMATNYLETIKMMVSIGLGWSVLPKTMTRGLEIIHVPDHYIERQLGVIQYRGRRLSNAATAFKEVLAIDSKELRSN